MATNNTYRAAYWTDGQSDVRLTSEDQQRLPDDDLMAEAKREADEQGLVMGEGRIVIGDYTE